jgi:hypothetical protein
MSAALITKHEISINAKIHEITLLIEAEERAIAAHVMAHGVTIAYLSGQRQELRDSLLDDSQIVTHLVDAPLLNGGARLTIGEARRVVDDLSDFVCQHLGE